MIKNDKQYQVTKARLIEFIESLDHLEQESLDALSKELHRNAIESKILEFNEQIVEYEKLRAGALTRFEIDGLECLYEALIKGRIVRKLSQGELAKSLAMKEQQIQRYEATNYQSASIDRLDEVAAALGLEFAIKVKLKDEPILLPPGVNAQVLTAIRERKSLLVIE